MDAGFAMKKTTLWTDCLLATLQDNGVPYGMIENGNIVLQGSMIVWVGAAKDMPAQYRIEATDIRSAGGRLVTPGLIDCHTHLVYAGDRAKEFEMRLQGGSYEDIAKAGGGIVSTVKATRQASADELFDQTQRRLRQLLSEGVTTVEVKSGYGLDLETERKCLAVARRLAHDHSVTVRTTFLGAHAVPPEFAGNADAYIDEVIRMLTVLHGEGLVDAVDAFCERIGFSIAQTQRVFEAAKALKLPVKLHAEQLSDSGGAALAAQYGALSCDHLEWLSEAGVLAMAQAGTVAVLLPGAYYFLRETKLPPIDLLRKHSVPIAIATDCNPGSSPCTSLLLMLNMACTLFRLTPEEAFAGVTRNAAKALGLSDRGILAAGMRGDIAIWDAHSPAQLCYAIGANPLYQSIQNGQSQ
jgi:imidazolonepropionase